MTNSQREKAHHTEPTVSCAIAAYNGSKFLKEAIASLLAQTLKHWEAVIVDDCSTDDTFEIASSFSDPRIRVFRNVENQGQSASLNTAIQHSRGRYIARLDADDIALPRRFELQSQFLDSNPDIGICGSSIQIFGYSKGNRAYPRSDKQARCELLFRSAFAHPAVMWNRQLFIDHSLWYAPELRYYQGEDYKLWTDASRHMKLANIPEVLTAYRSFAPGKKGINTDSYWEHASAYLSQFLDNSDLDRIRAPYLAFALPGLRNQVNPQAVLDFVIWFLQHERLQQRFGVELHTALCRQWLLYCDVQRVPIPIVCRSIRFFHRVPALKRFTKIAIKRMVRKRQRLVDVSLLHCNASSESCV